MTRAEEIAELLQVALHATGGESVEGAFVDSWVSDASVAVDRLEDLFRASGFGAEDADQVRAALRAEGPSPEAVAAFASGLHAFVGPLVEQLLADADARVRAIGAHAAAHAVPPDRWVSLLSDRDGEVRAAAVAAVARRRASIRGANDLLLRAMTDRDPRAFRAAALELRLTGPAVGEALAGAIAAAGGALAEELILGLADRVRREGVHCHGSRLVERVGQAVIDTLHHARAHASAEVRHAAVRALSRLGTPEIAALLFGQLQVETDLHVRRALVLHEGYSTVDGAPEHLIDLMRSDPDPWLRMQAAFRMELFGARAVPALIEALGDPPVARAAAMTLGRMGDRRALPGLLDAWSDARNQRCWQEIGSALAYVATGAAHRPPPAIPPDLVRALVAAWEPAGWVGQACKELGALSLHGDAIHIWALRPDGEILRLDHESVSPATEPELDPLIRFAVMAQGARRHPALRDLIPPPPKDARPCSRCRGTGGTASGCLTCRGLGWARSNRFLAT